MDQHKGSAAEILDRRTRKPTQPSLTAQQSSSKVVVTVPKSMLTTLPKHHEQAQPTTSHTKQVVIKRLRQAAAVPNNNHAPKKSQPGSPQSRMSKQLLLDSMPAKKPLKIRHKPPPAPTIKDIQNEYMPAAATAVDK